MEPETALSESARSRIEEALAANQTYDGDLPDWLDGWSAEGTVETGIPGDIGMMLRGENADSVQRWAEREDCLLNAFYAYWHSGLFNHADRLLGERDEVKKAILLGINTVSIGSLTASIVHPREVFKAAILMGAANIILAHNHPSGDPSPSKDDIKPGPLLIGEQFRCSPQLRQGLFACHLLLSPDLIRLGTAAAGPRGWRRAPARRRHPA